MTDQTLTLLADEVRGKTLRSAGRRSAQKREADGISDADSLFHAPQLHNPILWHAGHALIVVEHLGVAPAPGGSRLSGRLV